MAIYHLIKNTDPSQKTEKDKYLNLRELRALLASIHTWKHPNSVRDYTLIFLAASLGLRVSEAVSLTYGAFVKLPQNIVLINSLKKRRAGARDAVTVSDEVRDVIFKQLAVAKHRAKDWVFPSPEIARAHISDRYARMIFDWHIRKAGLNGRYSFHSLRHFAGVYLWSGSKDLEYVKKQMRHENIATTGIYMHMSVEDRVGQSRKLGSILGETSGRPKSQDRVQGQNPPNHLSEAEPTNDGS